MPLNKNRNNNYVGFEDIIENQEHSRDFKKIKQQVALRKKMLKTDKKVKSLVDTSLFKYSKLYENNNGSGYSVLEENLTNFNIAMQAKDLTDLVTYVATKEFDDISLKSFNKFLNKCSKCIKEIQVQEVNAQSKKKKLNARSVDYNNKFSEEVYLVASTANNLVGNVASNANNILKLYKGKNRIIFTPENYVVYNLATVNDNKLLEEQSVQNSVLIPRIQQAYSSMFKEKLQLDRIPTLNKKINKFHLNDALLIESNFNVNELPSVYMTIQSQTANKRTNFLTDMNKNRFALMKNTDLPLTIVRFPDKEYSSQLGIDVPADYSKQKQTALQNLATKYPNTIVSFASYKSDKYYTGYSVEGGKIKVNVNSAKEYQNESSTPKDIVNAIFQTERANNEVSLKDINKTLLLTRKLRVNGKGNVEEKMRLSSHNKLSYKHRVVVKEKDLIIKDKEIYKFFKDHGINNYESLMQRAIALGATMNTLKLTDYLDAQQVKACHLFLESQFNKTISLLASLDKNWVLPYITEKISQSFELEVNKLGLAKQDVLDRFAKNGMAVNADTTCTLRQIAFAKPKYEDVLKRIKDANDLSNILNDILQGNAVESVEDILNNNSDYETERTENEVEEENETTEQETQAEPEEVVEEENVDKPFEKLDVAKLVKKVFEREQAKVEKKIFDKSEQLVKEKEKAKYNSAYVLSSTVLDLYDDVLNNAEMEKNEFKKEALINKDNLTEDEKVLKTALEYNEGYAVITHLISNTIFENTNEIAEKTGRTDKIKIARNLANSLSKTINLMIARDYEKICDINIIRKDAKENSYTDVLKTKKEELLQQEI